MRNIGVFTEECVYFKDKIQGSSHKMRHYIIYLLSVLKTSLWQCSSSSSSINVGEVGGGGGGAAGI